MEEFQVYDEQQITIELLFEKYYRELFVYSFFLFDYRKQFYQEAEDCVQDTFEKALYHQSSLLNHEEPYRYLKAMCKNITITKRRNIYRRFKKLGYPESIEACNDVADAKDIVMDWIIQQENIAAKEALLNMLTNKEKEVYHFYYEKCQTIKGTAKALDCSDTSVRGSIQRIRSKAMKLQIVNGI